MPLAPPGRPEVERAACALLGPAAQVLEWRALPLGVGSGANPTTAQLLRLEGTAAVGAEVQSWSAVVKTLTAPAPLAGLDMGTQAGHWNYWRREALLYDAGVLERMPPGLRAPRRLATEQLGPALVRLWLEDLGPPGPAWDLARYALAARHLGRLGGGGLDQAPAADWLRGSLLRQWADSFPVLIPRFFADDPAVWREPFVRAVLPARSGRTLRELLHRRGELLAVLDRLPQTLCHRDFARENLWSRTVDDEDVHTVALDWALAGPGVLGEDLGTLALSAWDDIGGDDWKQTERRLVEAYVDGLADVDAPADAEAVRFAMTAAAALRYSLYELFLLHRDGPGEGLHKARRFSHLVVLAQRTLAGLDARRSRGEPPTVASRSPAPR